MQNPRHGINDSASATASVGVHSTDTSGANNASVSLVTPKPLLRSIRFPSSAIGAFRHAVNPSTRTPQFGHLKDTQLYDAIKKLPEWEQMQELEPWFNPLIIALTYLRNREGLILPYALKPEERAALRRRLPEMGFSKSTAAKDNLGNLRNEYRKHLRDALAFLCSHNPPKQFPPSGLAETTFTIPGPIDCSYTVINEPFPTAMLYDFRDPTRKAYTRDKNACPIAIMELYRDTKRMISIIVITWNRLRLLHPGLKLWGFGQKITDFNPDIFAGDSLITTHCFQAF